MSILVSPYQQFFNSSGEPLNAGYIYVGETNTNPQITANQIELFWDIARTLPAAQPLRTLNGYIVQGNRPAKVYMAEPGYSITVLDPNSTLIYSDLNASARSDVIIAVNDFGIVGNGTDGDGAVFRRAIASLGARGGSIYVPKPQVAYVLDAANGDPSNTAVFLPSNCVLTCEPYVSGMFIPGGNNTVMFRLYGLNGGLENVTADNRTTAFSNCSVIRLAPIDEADTAIQSDIEFNRITGISARGFAETITLRPGPKVGSQDSYLYYNTFTNIDARNNTRGIWLKDSPNGSAGANCNFFYAVRCGETGCNTGYQIDLGSENNFFGCAAEGVNSGTAPNATPTAIFIATGTGASTANNQFHGLRIEGCTLDVELNANVTTQFYGITNTGTINGTPGAYAGSQGIAYHGMPANNGARIFIDAPNNGEGYQFGDPASPTANNFFSVDLARSGGPTGYYEVKYQGQPLITWGGSGTGYASDMFVGNPLNGALILGQGNTPRVVLDGSGNLAPYTDNSISCGKSSSRFTAIWAVNGTIQTSGKIHKERISDIDSRVLSAWSKVNYQQYKFKDAVAEKGTKARYHIGVIADEVEAAFLSEGLNPFSFGVIYKFKNEKGEDEYGVNYSEILALECAYLRSLLQKGK